MVGVPMSTDEGMQLTIVANLFCHVIEDAILVGVGDVAIHNEVGAAGTLD